MYTKVLLLSEYIPVHNFNIICVSENYLNSEITPNGDNLKILEYNLCLLQKISTFQSY